MIHRIPAILLLMGIAFTPRMCEALLLSDLNIRFLDSANNNAVLATFADDKAQTINGKKAIPVAGTYGRFTISTCTTAIGCSGFPARVFADSTPTLDKLTLADAIVRYSPPLGTTMSGQLRIQLQSSHFLAVANGIYTFGVNAAGLAFGPGAASFTLSDSGFGNAPSDFSNQFVQPTTLTVPPFNPGSTSFLRQGKGTNSCGVVSCVPSLGGDVKFTFGRPGDAVKITQASLDFISSRTGDDTPVDDELARLAALPIGPAPGVEVPEPSTLLLLAVGLAGVALTGRRGRLWKGASNSR